MSKNRLREIREEQGLSRAELSRLSGVSVTTIREIEIYIREGSKATKYKLVNGLNSNPKKTRGFTFEEIFANK